MEPKHLLICVFFTIVAYLATFVLIWLLANFA